MKHVYSLLLALVAAPVALASAQVPPRRPPEPHAFPPPGVGALPPGQHVLLPGAFRVMEPPHLPGEFHLMEPPQLPEYAFARLARDLMPRPQTWYQDDPADSLYRVAHAQFSRQEYRPAAQRFSDLRGKYPNSRYFCDAAYYEAFSRYRLGTPNDLRTGYRVLESMSGRCTTATGDRGLSRGQDVPQLRMRVDGALARLGDSDAAERIKRAASEGQKLCDTDERMVKIEALSALAQMDPESANPVLRQVLATKDECSAPIRMQAIQMVARRNDQGAVVLLGQIARTDANRDLQAEAIRTLGRMSTDAAFAALEEFLRTSSDERLQSEAAMTLARSDQPRAQTAARALIERNDVSERVRLNVINTLASRGLSTEWWRGVYNKLESDALRQAVVYAIAKNDDSQPFLLALAANTSEPFEARNAAISRVRATAPVNELYKLLESADSRSMRTAIVSGLNARNEPEATDRLIDIAKTSTDPEVRSAAIRALSQGTRKNDPKVIKALADILAKGSL